MPVVKIISRWDSSKVLHEGEYEDLRTAVGYAVSQKVNLGGANLCGANLRGADLRGADLYRADLGGAYLGGANLCGADLRGADLRGADLYRADLGGAYLGGADLRGADLCNTDLRGAYLRGADLCNTDLKGVLGISQNRYSILLPLDADGDRKVKPVTFDEFQEYLSSLSGENLVR